MVWVLQADFWYNSWITWNCNFLGDFLVWKQSNKFLTLLSMERERKQQGMTQVYFSKSGRHKKYILGFFFLNSLSKIAYVEFTSRNYDLQRKVTNQTWLIFACYMSLAQSNNCKKIGIHIYWFCVGRLNWITKKALSFKINEFIFIAKLNATI